MKSEQIKNKPLFSSINKVPYQYPWLSADEECDVLVVGGGMAGAFCLYHLMENGADAVMVTQKPVGYASSCVNNSILQSTNDIMLTKLCKVIGKDEAIAYCKECDNALGEIEELSQQLDNFDFVRRDGFLYTATAENINELHTEYLMRRHNGFDVNFLEKTDASDMFSFDIQAGILAKGMAGEVDGYKLCHALISKANFDGARIYENTTIETIENTDGGVLVETTFGKRIKAKKIVMAIGMLSQEYIDVDVSKKTSFTLVTQPVSAFSGYQSRAIVKNMDTNIFLRTTQDDRILIGGLDCPSLNHNTLKKIIGIDRLIERKYCELETNLRSMLVGIDNLTVEYKYHGEYPFTDNPVPITQEVAEYPNIIFALPTSLNGILSSQIMAKKIASDISI